MAEAANMTHVVLFKMPDTFDAVLAEAASTSKKLLEIPGVQTVQFGKTFTTERAQGWTHVLVVQFDSKESLPGYGPHPIHKAWADKFARPYMTEILGVDIDGLRYAKI
uniref:Stress-response A/B barrel domain-containing protein n=1 Tax=Aplanochytrium stocchinoi TaxID=215587 RepID=A0A7S3V0R8_9STRA|mmetsp:Transcript_20464/g.24799  ORF Transcript_20464/g.24799 Transcript_20464/m.24799 type:complete len:108 (+) Transcript_20464:130-453(+)